MGNTFGEMFRRLRLGRGMTLRQFCEAHGFDPGNISRIERGVFPPPESPEKVEEYAQALGLKRGSTDWIEFLDRATAGRGQIPEDLMADEAVVNRLPLLFRTLRGERVPREKLDELVKFIRSADRYGP